MNTYNLQRAHIQNIQNVYTPIRKKNPVENEVRDLNRHFTKEDIHIINKLMKTCSILLVIKDMQIKTMIHYYIFLKMAKKKKDFKLGRQFRKTTFHVRTLGRSVYWYND